MSAILKVAVSQRVDSWADRGERRDALDQRLCKWLVAIGCVPIPVPNTLMVDFDEECLALKNWLLVVRPDAVLLSGGNDIGEAVERDNTEHRLLVYAKERNLPVLGICRGMHMMSVWSGGSLAPVSGHVRTRHSLHILDSSSEWPDEVNSFHNFTLAACPSGFVVTARAEDGAIESIRHEILPWEGWMWHPERESVFNATDIMRFRTLLASRNVH